MITFFDAHDENKAIEIFNEIETWAKESGFPPIKKFCAKLRKKWVYIANYFMCKISTRVSEGLNYTIKALLCEMARRKKSGSTFMRKIPPFVIRIIFHRHFANKYQLNWVIIESPKLFNTITDGKITYGE